jgi:hypothetical protein
MPAVPATTAPPVGLWAEAGRTNTITAQTAVVANKDTLRDLSENGDDWCLTCG